MDFLNSVADVIIRIILPLLAIVIVYEGYVSIRHRRREERPLIMLFDEERDKYYPVYYWENSIGRSRGSDIQIKDITVSRDHAVLLRRETAWYITDTGSKSGVYLNGKIVRGKVPVYVNAVVTVGNRNLTLKRVSDCTTEIYSETSREFRKKAISPIMLMLTVSLFLIFMTVGASLSNNIDSKEIFMLCGAYLGFSWLFYVISTFALKIATFELESIALMLTGIGIILIAGTSIKQAYTQFIAAACGIVAYCFLIKFMEKTDRVMKWRFVISVIAIILFVINLIFGSVKNGAQNWIEIGPISIQPSEFVKIAFIFVGASTLDFLQTKKNLTGFILFSALCIGALFIMGDFGTACIFYVTFLLISFMRSGSIATVILGIAAAVIGVMFILSFKPYIATRFEAWGHVWEYANTSGYQQANVLTYSASGGLFGVGIGNGQLKNIFAATSDLAFGLMCEELGVILAIIIVSAVAGLALYTRGSITRSRSTFYSISACTAAGLLVFQAGLNIFGATDILPLTGVTLPFISQGGSSIISVWGLLSFMKAADERTYGLKRK